MRRLAIFLLIFLSIGAIPSAIMLITRPDGSLLQLSTNLLQNSPFKSFLIPGAVLLTVNGLLPILGVYLIQNKKPAASNFLLVQGVLLCGWIYIEVLVIKQFDWLQVFYLCLGIIFIYLNRHVKNLIKS